MEVAVVFESMFGNTRGVAEAVAEGVREADPEARVTVLGVAEATPERIGGAALIVGGPTHVLGMSREASRRNALQAAGTGPDESATAQFGVREWLAALPRSGGRQGVGGARLARRHLGRSGLPAFASQTPVRPAPRAAAFDTRIASPFAGGAARSIAKSLRQHGFAVLAEPVGFVVDTTEGPLRAGERDRAKAWGAHLARMWAE